MRKEPKILVPELGLVEIELIRQQISRDELARRLGLSRGTVKNLLNGSNRARKPRLALEKLLGAQFFPDLAPYRKHLPH